MMFHGLVNGICKRFVCNEQIKMGSPGLLLFYSSPLRFSNLFFFFFAICYCTQFKTTSRTIKIPHILIRLMSHLENITLNTCELYQEVLQLTDFFFFFFFFVNL